MLMQSKNDFKVIRSIDSPNYSIVVHSWYFSVFRVALIQINLIAYQLLFKISLRAAYRCSTDQVLSYIVLPKDIN